MRAALLALLCLPAPLLAQRRPALPAPFDTARTLVPTTFRSVSLSSLFQQVARPRRGEYETTEQWLARIQEARSGVIGRFYAVWYNPRSCQMDSIWAFEPDSQVVRLHVPLNGIAAIWSDGPERDIDTPAFLPATCQRLRASVRTGQNAFGVSRVYPSGEWLQYGLILPGDFMRYETFAARESRRPGPIWLSFHMPTDSVRRLRPFFRYLLVFRVREAAPDVRLNARGLYSHAPTMDEPWDLDLSMGGVLVDYASLWVVDSRRGEVIRKLSLPGPGAPLY